MKIPPPPEKTNSISFGLPPLLCHTPVKDFSILFISGPIFSVPHRLLRGFHTSSLRFDCPSSKKPERLNFSMQPYRFLLGRESFWLHPERPAQRRALWQCGQSWLLDRHCFSPSGLYPGKDYLPGRHGSFHR